MNQNSNRLFPNQFQSQNFPNNNQNFGNSQNFDCQVVQFPNNFNRIQSGNNLNNRFGFGTENVNVLCNQELIEFKSCLRQNSPNRYEAGRLEEALRQCFVSNACVEPNYQTVYNGGFQNGQFPLNQNPPPAPSSNSNGIYGREAWIENSCPPGAQKDEVKRCIDKVFPRRDHDYFCGTDSERSQTRQYCASRESQVCRQTFLNYGDYCNSAKKIGCSLSIALLCFFLTFIAEIL